MTYFSVWLAIPTVLHAGGFGGNGPCPSIKPATYTKGRRRREGRRDDGGIRNVFMLDIENTYSLWDKGRRFLLLLSITTTHIDTMDTSLSGTCVITTRVLFVRLSLPLLRNWNLSPSYCDPIRAIKIFRLGKGGRGSVQVSSGPIDRSNG